MENVFFRTYIFTENIRKKFKIKIPLFSSNLYVDWIHLDSSKQIEHILVRRRGRFMLWKYFLIVKNRAQGSFEKDIFEISLKQYLSYKENLITHIHKLRKNFSFKKDANVYKIVYDRYQDGFKKYSVITVTSETRHALKYFNINDIVQSPAEECILSGLDLIYYLQQKQSS
jgi:hypothetical protein